MSTNYLAASTLYNKVSVEATKQAVDHTRALEEERKKLMSYNFADEDVLNKMNGSKGKNDVRAKLQGCKCCNWSSPKFYQVIMNDIPLLICTPCAYILGLLDNVNAAAMIFMTLLDLIAMLFYLNYDEEVSIDAA